MTLSRSQWRARRKKYARVVVELTEPEMARWQVKLQELGQKGATRLRRLILQDLGLPDSGLASRN